MAHVLDVNFHERPPEVEEIGGQQGSHPGQPPSAGRGVSAQSERPYINFVPRANAERLSLIQGDSETFSDILGLIGEYEAVLDRRESLAVSLGAKLPGPRLLKGIENFFDGPIKTISSQPFLTPITWLDVVSFARSKPDEFILTTLPDGSRCCRFFHKGFHLEITEDYWRLISSGALERFPLEHPFEEDEVAELATLDILEQRASILYKKADEVAARARILHHRLGHRKNDLPRIRSRDSGGLRYDQAKLPGYRHSFSSSYDLHADLLQQFSTATSPRTQSRSTSVAGLSLSSLGPLSPSLNSPHHHHHRHSMQSLRSPGGTPQDLHTTNHAESRGEVLRFLINRSTDRLSKGDIISPPCDRCRRLQLPCVKHLSACQGCTKKHAKCSWTTVTDVEEARIRYDLGIETDTVVDSDNDPQVPRDNPHARPPLKSRASVLSSESTSRPGSRADTDMGIPAMRSPNSVVAATYEPPPDSRPLSLPTGLGRASLPREKTHLRSSGQTHGDTDTPLSENYRPIYDKEDT